MTFLQTSGILAGEGAGGLTPLDYGDLSWFFDAENGVTESSNVVSSWTDDGPTGASLTVPSGHIGPDFESVSQNGLPGLSFEDPGSGSNRLRRKLSSSDNAFDNHFFAPPTKSLAFAARLDQASDPQGFGTENTIASKGSRHNQGWALHILEDGTIEFFHYMDNGSRFRIQASGFYEGSGFPSFPKLVLGHLNYDGTNTSSSASFRLYNGSSFVTVGSITTASGSSTKQSDASRDLVIGNVLDDTSNNINAPFEGAIFGVWATKPEDNAIDESYLERWIP